MGRATRMLDAAGELLLAHGYRRVTIDDVARRAGVGKGTVYLHFASKLDLFAGVLVRDSVDVTADLRAALLADPAEAALDATMRSTLLAVRRRPLTHALYTGDAETLGAIIGGTKAGLEIVTDKSDFTRAYLPMLHRHGLLTDDPATTPDLAFRLSAATGGFFFDHLVPAPPGMDADARADALATVVRRGFTPGPPAPEALAAAAVDLVALYDRTLAHLGSALPQEES